MEEYQQPIKKGWDATKHWRLVQDDVEQADEDEDEDIIGDV